MSLPTAWAALLLAFVTGCTSTAVVMTPSPVPLAGTPIRYAARFDSSRIITGRLVSLDADALAFERFVPELPGHKEHAHWIAERVPTDSIALLQARIRRSTRTGRGALIGGGIGLALGVLCAAGSDDSDWLAPSGGQCMVAGILNGVATGALIGALSHKDIWAPVSLPTKSPALPVTAAENSATQ